MTPETVNGSAPADTTRLAYQVTRPSADTPCVTYEATHADTERWTTPDLWVFLTHGGLTEHNARVVADALMARGEPIGTVKRTLQAHINRSNRKD